jgi:hypothetical protein
MARKNLVQAVIWRNWGDAQHTYTCKSPITYGFFSLKLSDHLSVLKLSRMTQRQNVLKINNLSTEDRLILQYNTAFDLEFGSVPIFSIPKIFRLRFLCSQSPPPRLVEDLASNSGSTYCGLARVSVHFQWVVRALSRPRQAHHIQYLHWLYCTDKKIGGIWQELGAKSYMGNISFWIWKNVGMFSHKWGSLSSNMTLHPKFPFF